MSTENVKTGIFYFMPVISYNSFSVIFYFLLSLAFSLLFEMLLITVCLVHFNNTNCSSSPVCIVCIVVLWLVTRHALTSGCPLELHLTTSELWFGQEQEGILP